MSVVYEITGGKLWIDKKAFVKEMMKAEGSLKQIFAFHAHLSGETKPKLHKNEEGVFLDYNEAAAVEITDKDIDIYKDLKQSLGDNMKGKLIMTMSFVASYIMELDFD